MASSTAAVWKQMASSVGAGDVLPGGAAGEPDEETARSRVPVGGAEAGEGGDEVDVAAVGHLGGQRPDLGRVRR